jgi:hypothetical protein
MKKVLTVRLGSGECGFGPLTGNGEPINGKTWAFPKNEIDNFPYR